MALARQQVSLCRNSPHYVSVERCCSAEIVTYPKRLVHVGVLDGMGGVGVRLVRRVVPAVPAFEAALDLELGLTLQRTHNAHSA